MAAGSVALPGNPSPRRARSNARIWIRKIRDKHAELRHKPTCSVTYVIAKTSIDTSHLMST